MPSATQPEVSVCVLTRGVSPDLDRCLASLGTQRGDVAFEVLVASDGDPAVAPLVHARFPDALVGLVQHAHPGHARNLLAEHARGALVWFLDDDVVVPPGGLAELVAVARHHPATAVFGGPNLTPPASSPFQRIQGAVLATALASGPVRRRYCRAAAGPTDERSLILCNLAVRRSSMIPFPPELAGGEENAMLSDVRLRHLSMRYEPGLAVYHERRPDLRCFAVQMLKYGRGRGQAARRRPATLRPGYLGPSALLAYLLLLPLWVSLTSVLLVPAALYAVGVAGQATAIGIPFRRIGAVAMAAMLILAVHVCYGVGVVRGLARKPRRRSHRAGRLDVLVDAVS